MKRKILFMFIMLLFPLIVNANEYSSNIICNTTNVKIRDEITCTLALTTDEEIDSYNEELNYDIVNLKLESVTGLNDWESRSNNNIYLSRKEKIELNKTKIATLTFKVTGYPETGFLEISIGNTSYKEIKKAKINVVSENNRLSSLSIKGQTFEFDPNKNEYELSVNTNKVTVLATLEDQKASFVENYGPRDITLNYGKNTININVKAENGKINVYSIVVNRLDSRNSNNNLKTLSVEGFKIDPEFNKDKLDYKVIIEKENIEEIEVKATLEDQKASFVFANRPKIYKLNEKETKIEVIVKAENGDTKTYTILVTKKVAGLANLKSLKLSTGLIEFNENKYEYSFNVSNEIDELQIEAEPKKSDSKVEIIKEEKLKVGKNIIKINVTNQDETNTYILNVNRLNKEEVLSSNTNLTNITIEGYNINFKPNQYTYDLKINNESKLNINIEKEDENSNVTIKGNKDLKNNSQIKIYVTSEDASQAIYTLNIKKSNKSLFIIIGIIVFAIISIVSLLIIFKDKLKSKKNLNEDLTLDVDNKKRLILK